jgi:glycerol-3-phosphate dehydrogenase (NAD(P)+)
MQTITILGAGSWGTALAVHLAGTGHTVRLYGRDPELMRVTKETRENATYLPGVALDGRIQPTSCVDEALDATSLVVVAIPSHGVRASLQHVLPHFSATVPIVSATKGIEQDTLMRMSDVIRQEAGESHPIVVISGPSFATELARGLPTAVSVASTDRSAAVLVQDEFHGPSLRLYVTDDVIGVELGGALKNVIAIAAGAVESLGLGHNAMAALITRGLAEMSRLAIAVGGRRETLGGLSGLGDLVLTCTGHLSRNRQVGVELGRGRQLDDVLASTRMVAEGVRTSHAALALGRRHGVELPITEQMHEVLDGRKSPRAAVADLMLRPQGLEH